MKILVIGIDGGVRNIIQNLEIPNLQKIMGDGYCLDLEEHLWSRGWSEILCGVHTR